jgi:hypothetical protein
MDADIPLDYLCDLHLRGSPRGRLLLRASSALNNNEKTAEKMSPCSQ